MLEKREMLTSQPSASSSPSDEVVGRIGELMSRREWAGVGLQDWSSVDVTRDWDWPLRGAEGAARCRRLVSDNWWVG